MNILGLIVLLVVVLAVFPRAGAYSEGWGYAPVSVGTVLLVIFLVWLFFGHGGLRL